VRILSILCAGIVGFSLLAAPASADPENNTSNTLFIVLFKTESTDNNFDEEPQDLLIINLASASTETGLEGFDLLFHELDLGDMDLTDLSYFLLGHVSGSEHLLLSAEGDGAPLDDTFEEGLEDGVRNMDNMDPVLADPGGMTFVSPDDFANQFDGFGLEGFIAGEGDISFDTVGLVGGETDLLGFTDPTFLGVLGVSFEGGQLVTNFQVPEPAFALLAALGLAAASIARRRRRNAA
jgi:hypothetical protein